MEYVGFELTDEGLKHYGVKGMRWGVRRYQPYPEGGHGTYLKKRQVRKAVRSMNYNSRVHADAKYNLEKSFEKGDKYAAKADKAAAQGKDKKYVKNLAKMNKELQDAAFHVITMNEASNEVKKTMASLSAGGYNVTSKEKKVMVRDKGKYLLNQALLGIPGQVLFNPRRTTNIYSAKKQPVFGIGSDGKPVAKNKEANDIMQKSKSNNKPSYAVVTSSEAKKLGLNDSTRVTGKEESDFWKAMAKQYTEEEKKKKRH